MYMCLTHIYIYMWILWIRISIVQRMAAVIVFMMMTMMTMGGIQGGVSMNYYGMSCPMAEMIVRETVEKALGDDPTLAAGLLRMHFHDCFVEGCDASILIDSTGDNTAEKDSPANLSLRGFEVIDGAKERTEEHCPSVVSCADIVALAARDAVFLSGGPFYPIALGRKDGFRSRIEDTFSLPPPFFNATQLIQVFGQRGFTPQDVVALSGAHTLGVARCSSFRDRLDAAGGGNALLRSLSLSCKEEGQSSFSAGLDPTSNSFDNAYFSSLLRGNGILTSDHSLVQSPTTRPLVSAYSQNQAMFFFHFQQAMRKMSLLSLKDDSNGHVRSNCRAIKPHSF